MKRALLDNIIAAIRTIITINSNVGRYLFILKTGISDIAITIKEIRIIMLVSLYWFRHSEGIKTNTVNKRAVPESNIVIFFNLII